MSFSDPVVAGETLARPAISSPNYVQGSAGWSISQTGSAEFEDVYIRGPGGRYIRIYLDPNTLIPVMDFHPPTPGTGGWNVSAGSVYTYSDGSGFEILGLSSPNQLQPAATGEATIELRSGQVSDPTTAVIMTATSVVIDGDLLHAPEYSSYLCGVRGTEYVTNSNVSTYRLGVSFSPAFDVGVVPKVFLNINIDDTSIERCFVHATDINYSGFVIKVESRQGGLMTWNNVPVSWVAFA